MLTSPVARRFGIRSAATYEFLFEPDQWDKLNVSTSDGKWGDSMELTGGCLCKTVRYRITKAPVTARACWCRMCQTIGGGSGTVNAIFDTAALTVEGELREFKYVADSGNIMYCRFCPTCGTHVLITSQKRPHFTAVRVGTLDDPNQLSPESTIWASMAPTWAAIDPNLPRLDSQPPPGRSTLQT